MTALALALALALDALLGEPRWIWDRWPHPAVMTGRLIAAADRRFNGGAARRLKGALLAAGLVAAGLIAGLALAALPGIGAEVILGAILLAQRSLAGHVRAVADSLRLSVGDGQRSVAMIVGRDTGDLDRPAIARAAIESAAENLSDGVVAPAFWFLVGGLPGLLVYKAINTADSMIGYLTPRHADFGRASARLDDLLNLIPARLTALMLRAPWRGDFGAIRAEARRHRSPNAGWPEAAMARALGIALSGPRSYQGEMRDFPWVNPAGRHDIGPDEIDAAVARLWRVWGLLVSAALALAIL